MTTQELHDITGAQLAGKEIECCPIGFVSAWEPISKDHKWDTTVYRYRVKPSVPKRVFTLADFPNGTLVRNDVWPDGERSLVITWHNNAIGTYSGVLTIREINGGEAKSWSFSTDSGKTWNRLAP